MPVAASIPVAAVAIVVVSAVAAATVAKSLGVAAPSALDVD